MKYLILMACCATLLDAMPNWGSTASQFPAQCASLVKKLDIPGANISFSQFVPAGTTLQFPNSDASCGRPLQVVSSNICRVSLYIPTSSISGVSMEAWLPQDWTGRFLSAGNGGLGGCVQYEDIDYATSLGFAAVGTNNGHNGMSGQAFLNNPGVVEDFAYRALHLGVVTGKSITKTFYGRKHTKSYYLGCSTGGRQGFKEAQSFPDDFDGIVAGAPAFSFNNLTSWSSNFLVLSGPVGSATFVPISKWTTIHNDILKQCDGLDGYVDGILESPDLCKYNPDGLICTPGQENSSDCLTPTQAETVRKTFSPLYDTAGSLVYPEMQVGAELTGMPQTYFNGQPFGASDWFRYAIFNNASWDPTSLTPKDWLLSSRLNRYDIETWHGDLSAFKKRQGKLLHYHGLADGIISSSNSPRYYQHVSKTMGLSSAQLDQFYRYFPVSGMAHCGGGPGASFIGNQARNLAGLDPAENVLMAMVRWVENGVAPDTITGTAYINGTKDAGIDFKRRHCRWPRRNHFRGLGNPKDPNNWACV
ncbi:Tannase/feruloyl esterase [Bisporella sp. PMI_857]|nr:Tannase/feruloyl esterase [Bisporella sp. PMI_857]